MKEAVLHLFEQYPETAVAISLFLSILVAVAGVVPSFFITAANILFFGFWPGTVISFLGEALGAVLAFLLYRKGFKKNTNHQLQKFPGVQRLIKAEGRQAFLLILSLRLLPFVPSGLVTFAASIANLSALNFLAAIFFFFSSRRRHTRLVSDWTDVCSSDLDERPASRTLALVTDVGNDLVYGAGAG